MQGWVELNFEDPLYSSARTHGKSWGCLRSKAAQAGGASGNPLWLPLRLLRMGELNTLSCEKLPFSLPSLVNRVHLFLFPLH